ncbi:MAG TPA: hypothetical protein VGU27_04255, partial [Candidatus Eisenbacteria bacterium]|nr:hypothetical protein [Candidatus Eisenbacteria bacterium]
IRHVDVLCLTIFDPLPRGRLTRLYALANRLHVRTRPATVRALLLFRPGDPWSADRAAETERLLRSIEYIEPDPISARTVGDSVDVVVVTHDQWTTQPELNVESGGGTTSGSLGFTERNLLGLGLGVSASYHHDPAGTSRQASLWGQRLFGTDLQTRLQAGNGSAGAQHWLSVGEPFVALDSRRTWGASWARTATDVQLFQGGALAAEFPRDGNDVEVEWGVGARAPDSTVRRFTLQYTQHDRRLGASTVQPGAPASFAGPNEDLRLHRVAGEARLWRPHYIQRRGVETIDPIEDFDVGSSLALLVGFAPRALGSTADEGYGRVRWDAGWLGGSGFGLLHAALESRVRGGPRETLGTLDARWVQQPDPRLTLVCAAHAIAGQHMLRDFQAVIGGLNGLRAYPVQELAGDEAWRLNAETRWVAARDVWSLVSLGAAAFGDAARTWGPGSDAAPWHEDAGLGLRLALPHASLHQLARFDVAWPLSPARDGRRQPVFSFGSQQAF